MSFSTPFRPISFFCGSSGTGFSSILVHTSVSLFTCTDAWLSTLPGFFAPLSTWTVSVTLSFWPAGTPVTTHFTVPPAVSVGSVICVEVPLEAPFAEIYFTFSSSTSVIVTSAASAL